MHEELRKWLSEQDMTQAALARQIGLDDNYVAMICRGDRPFTDGFRLRFMEQFGFDPARGFANGHQLTEHSA